MSEERTTDGLLIRSMESTYALVLALSVFVDFLVGSKEIHAKDLKKSKREFVSQQFIDTHICVRSSTDEC